MSFCPSISPDKKQDIRSLVLTRLDLPCPEVFWRPLIGPKPFKKPKPFSYTPVADAFNDVLKEEERAIENERIKQLSETPLETYMRHQREEEERLRKEEEERIARSIELMLGAFATEAELIRAIDEEKARQREAALEAARIKFATLTEEEQFAYIEARTAIDELDLWSVGLAPDDPKFIELLEKAYAIYQKLDVYIGAVMAVGAFLANPTPMGLLEFMNDALNVGMSMGDERDTPDVIGGLKALFKIWREKRRKK